MISELFSDFRTVVKHVYSGNQNCMKIIGNPKDVQERKTRQTTSV
jgi:hypothetical protein